MPCWGAQQAASCQAAGFETSGAQYSKYRTVPQQAMQMCFLGGVFAGYSSAYSKYSMFAPHHLAIWAGLGEQKIRYRRVLSRRGAKRRGARGSWSTLVGHFDVVSVGRTPWQISRLLGSQIGSRSCGAFSLASS